jgi:hypothetical protein
MCVKTHSLNTDFVGYFHLKFEKGFSNFDSFKQGGRLLEKSSKNLGAKVVIKLGNEKKL